MAAANTLLEVVRNYRAFNDEQAKKYGVARDRAMALLSEALEILRQEKRNAG